ncbi:ATP-binding cassette domain-containing protein [Kitasatospora cineracea]
MSGSSLLTVEGLTVEHPGGVRALDGVDLQLAAGAALVLLGESGSGKTTLARAVLGLTPRTGTVRGSIRLDGTELLGRTERDWTRIRGRRIGYVPQDPSATLDPLRRIGAQLAEVLRVHGLAGTRRAARAAALPLLAAAGLPDPERAAHAHPHELSGGLRQRAALALAMAGGPELLIADEPTTALDTLVRARVLDLFTALRTERGLALLLVTHDLAAAARIGGTVAVLAHGRLTATGPAEELLVPESSSPVRAPGNGGPGPRPESPAGGSGNGESVLLPVGARRKARACGRDGNPEPTPHPAPEPPHPAPLAVPPRESSR